MKNIKYLYLIVLVGFLFSSCQEWIDYDDPKIEYSKAWPITGEWNVSEYYDDGAGGLENAYGPYSINMFNSSFSEDSIWIDNIYDSGIKVKARKTGTNTFAVQGAIDVEQVLETFFEDEYSIIADFTYDIYEGEVVGTDSIIMNVIIFMDTDTFDNYYEAGPRMTGFEGID